MKFTFESQISVRPPYRLDLTARALRRTSPNVVDTFEDGVYRRALADARGTNLIEVRQPHENTLLLRVSGSHPHRWTDTVSRMLGTGVRLDEWYRRVRAFPWLAALSDELRGLRPPRYPTLWEAAAHAIIFQQISIHAASSIMRRLVESLSEPLTDGVHRYHPFITPAAITAASDAALRSAGLSGNKAAHLRATAGAILSGSVDEALIDKLDSVQAAGELTQLRGIGAWSAAVILLRGFGRLDVFPLKDSGVARAFSQIAPHSDVDPAQVLEALGPVRGMLYFHLLLGRLLPARPQPAKEVLR